jgi:hypothetical protein
MNSLMKAAALAAALFAFAETASAETVTCPLPNARREITTALPSGWWTTPIVNTLTETKIQNIGGKPALMCIYGPAGSIQRDAPANSNCTAQTGGFDCKVNLVIKPGVLGHLGGLKVQPINPGTYKSAILNVRQTFTFDLDEGVEQGAGGAADLWFEADTATLLYIVPRNGATMWTGDRSNRNYEGCAGADAHYTADRISLSDLPVGSYVCVKTNGGRISQYRINALSAGSPKTLTIGFTTWNK